jgi:hypothetical protein
MVWGTKGSARQWLEPFFAIVRASEDAKLLGYHIMCGDAATGLGKLRYTTSAASVKRPDPTDWFFVFFEGAL